MKILIARMSPFGYTAIFELLRLGHHPLEISGNWRTPSGFCGNYSFFQDLCGFSRYSLEPRLLSPKGDASAHCDLNETTQDGFEMKLHVFIVCLGSSLISHTHVQAASQTAAASSVAAANPSEAKPVLIPATLAESHPNGSPHLNASSNPKTATLNRQVLERQAGRDAGKLLLRSEPPGAQVWIDGLFIGKTPVLLLLAPGRHRIEIQGPRQKFASRVLELLPRETSDVAMKLTVRYPTNVIVR